MRAIAVDQLEEALLVIDAPARELLVARFYRRTPLRALAGPTSFIGPQNASSPAA